MYEDASSEFGIGWRIATKPATLVKLWVIAFGPSGAIYVGTIPGSLFVSRDGGASFELNRPLWNHESRGGDLFSGEGTGETKWFGTPASDPHRRGGDFAPGIHSISVDPRDPARMLIAVSSAGVLETVDGGQTWRSRNKGMTMDHSPEPEAEWGHDPHYIERCEGDPDHVWQQNHTGVFYTSHGQALRFPGAGRSSGLPMPPNGSCLKFCPRVVYREDAAATWRKVNLPAQGVRFGFPSATDDRDGKVAWLVPGKADNLRMTIEGALFVARTDDGGATWTQLRKGLPQTNAYDVVYRHALAHKAGVVAFGSTTGNLYVSEDRGDSWTAVANNLPPIYSVRVA